MSQSQAWMDGVVFAAGYLVADRDQPTLARELLELIGIDSVSQLRDLGCDDIDIERVRPLLIEIRRRAGARRHAAKTGKRLPAHLAK